MTYSVFKNLHLLVSIVLFFGGVFVQVWGAEPVPPSQKDVSLFGEPTLQTMYSFSSTKYKTGTSSGAPLSSVPATRGEVSGAKEGTAKSSQKKKMTKLQKGIMGIGGAAIGVVAVAALLWRIRKHKPQTALGVKCATLCDDITPRSTDRIKSSNGIVSSYPPRRFTSEEIEGAFRRDFGDLNSSQINSKLHNIWPGYGNPSILSSEGFNSPSRVVMARYDNPGGPPPLVIAVASNADQPMKEAYIFVVDMGAETKEILKYFYRCTEAYAARSNILDMEFQTLCEAMDSYPNANNKLKFRRERIGEKWYLYSKQEEVIELAFAPWMFGPDVETVEEEFKRFRSIYEAAKESYPTTSLKKYGKIDPAVTSWKEKLVEQGDNLDIKFFKTGVQVVDCRHVLIQVDNTSTGERHVAIVPLPDKEDKVNFLCGL